MALPLFLIGGAVVRAVGPRIVKEIIKRGGKKISQQAANKITQNPATITNINKIPKPSGKRISPNPQIRTAAGMKPFKPLPRAAGTRKAGPKAGEVKVKPSTSVTTRKPSAVTAPKPSSVAIPRSRPTRPSMRNITPSGGQRALPKPPPSRPIPQGQRVANIGKAGVAGVTAATTTKEKAGKPSVSKVMPTGPMSRPKRNAPNIGMPRPDPRGDQIKPTPGDKVAKKVVMPKKFDGSYSKKEQRLVNITIDGKKATYEIPKGMSTKEATSLLKGTAKKKAGGTPGKYKGFSKLPEAVQKKMSPRLAAKYEAGGYLDRMEKRLSMMESARNKKEKDKYKPIKSKGKKLSTKKMKNGKLVGKPVPMPKVPPANPKFKGKPKPMPKMPRLHPEFTAKPTIKKYKKVLLKGGGSVGNGKVARQVKGFGAARKPKK